MKRKFNPFRKTVAVNKISDRSVSGSMLSKLKTIQKATLLPILIVLLTFGLTSCSTTMTVESGEETDTPSPTVSAALPTPEASETPHATLAVSNPPPDGRPIVISYIENTDAGGEIVSSSLNSQSNYGSIPVVTKTTFQGPVAIDDENNLYLVYGARENYVSKLSVDGNVETIELPYWWQLQTLWVGDKLFVLPKSSDNSMSVIDTDLQITTLSPAIDALDDGTRTRGTIGISNTSPTALIWVSSLPIEDETGDYALYRTLSLESLEINEQRLKIPNSIRDGSLSAAIERGPDNRLNTIVVGIDQLNNNALLCYNYGTTERVILTNLEIYDLDAGESITSFQYCCMNGLYDLRGDTIIENASQVYNLSDFQPIFDVIEFIDIDGLSYYWMDSNGAYWQILTKDEIIVVDEGGQLEARYDLPSTVPMDLLPEFNLLPAFLLGN